MCGVSEHLAAIGLMQWCDEMTNTITTQSLNYGRSVFLTQIRTTLAHYLEHEHCILKMPTSMLELALWKKKMNEDIQGTKRRCKSGFRGHCRIRCGSDNVVRNVLQFLTPAKVVADS